ncbi:RhaT Permeases of the drug/metabolite transporter (DMT) superfamily [Rhabdaerophilaceae bacterium]
MPQSQTNLRGIVFMLIAMFGFISNDACMKMARQTMETGQALIIRGIFALVMVAIVLVATRSWAQLSQLSHRYVVMRAVLEGVIAIMFITALGVVALADITAMLMLAPLMVTGISVLFFGEKVGWRRWSAICTGFAGILLVVQPGNSDAPIWALALGFASVLLVAVRDSLTKGMPPAISSLTLTVAATLGTMSAAAMLVLWGQAWVPVALPTLGILALAAVFALIGLYFIIQAHREADLSVISPFRYSIVFWALLFGFVIFGDVPTPMAIIGLTLVIGSGIYLMHRERVRRLAAEKH